MISWPHLKVIVFLLSPLCAADFPLQQTELSPTQGEWQPILQKHLWKHSWQGGLPDFSERSHWEKLAREKHLQSFIKRADALKGKKFELPPKALYMEYFEKGTRDNYQKAHKELFNAASDLSVAYLMTADKAYLKQLQEVLTLICNMKTWVFPAHDKGHKAYDGKEICIDLASSLASWRLALIYRLLHEELGEQHANQLKEQLHLRTLTPIRKMLAGELKELWWFKRETNWNAVCWTGVLGCTLALEENGSERTALVDAAMRHIGFSLRGFGADGYCSEGVGYWNYGYGHNLRFAVIMSIATDGKIGLMKNESMRRPADYPERIALSEELYPAYADCALNIKVTPFCIGLRDFLLNKPTAAWSNLIANNSIEDLSLALAVPRPKGKEITPAAPEPVSLFAASGIAVLRPIGSKARLAASFKGGSNDELHNHNDVGSYLLALDGVAMLIDPGTEKYTASTFGPKRYDSQLIGSYGHPVPLISGQMQHAGKETHAKLLNERKNKNEFAWLLDISAAYPKIEGLKKLERHFLYNRKKEGLFTITDIMESTTARTFETALITPGEWKKLSATKAQITHEGKTIEIEVKSSSPFDWSTEELKAKVSHKIKITRIALRLREPQKKVHIQITCRPSLK